MIAELCDHVGYKRRQTNQQTPAPGMHVGRPHRAASHHTPWHTGTPPPHTTHPRTAHARPLHGSRSTHDRFKSACDFHHGHHASCKRTRRALSTPKSVGGTTASMACTTSDPSIAPEPSASALLKFEAAPSPPKSPKCRNSSRSTHACITSSSLLVNTRNPTAHTGSGQQVELAGRGARSCTASRATCERGRAGGEGEGGWQRRR